MSAEDVMKKYLISLGFEVEDEGYRRFNNMISKASSEVSKHTSIMSSSWVKEGGVIVGTMGVIVSSTAIMLDSLAKADLGYKTYAMNMYMAVDAAKEFKIVTEAMGKSQAEISWMKELNVQYKELMRQASSMALPNEYREQMEFIRGIGFEFTRMKVESVYALEWIGYHLVKNLIDPLNKSKFGLKEFNDYIQKNIGTITKEIADILTFVLEPIMSLGIAIKDIGGLFVDLWNSLGTPEKWALIAAAMGGIAYALGPLYTMLVALPFLVNDFYAALKGGATGLPIGAWQFFVALLDKALRLMTSIIAIGSAGWELVKAPWQLATTVNRMVNSAIKDKGAIARAYETPEEARERIAADKEYVEEYNKLGAIWGKVTGVGKDILATQIDDEFGMERYIQKNPGILISGESRERVADLVDKASKGEQYSIKNIPQFSLHPKEVRDYLLQNSIEGKSGVMGAGQTTNAMQMYNPIFQEAFGPQANLMLRVMQAESGGRKDVVVPVTEGTHKGTYDVGLMQINTMHLNDLRRMGIASSIEDLKKVDVNLKAAKWLLSTQGISAWESSRTQKGGYGWGQQGYSSGVGGNVSITNNFYGGRENIPEFEKMIQRTAGSQKAMVRYVRGLK